ncbi:hypothetical protein PT286_00775 [Neisseriaceae bacterium ESL0693]|nr:hypothetical protein [Neisseriaceae bacterium ESL0693]
MCKPVIFSDLDDTLFQTQRKISAITDSKAVRVGALDRNMQPRSFMTAEQAVWVDWLLGQAELIPVTARGTEEISRVQIAFNSWVITTHGAVILNPAGQIDETWKKHILPRLLPYADRLTDMQQTITAIMQHRGIDAWARINYEYDQIPVYLVMKHRNSSRIDELYEINKEIEQQISSEGFYIHRNDNNIAWLPQPVDKGLAVDWLLKKLKADRGLFPVIGIGDSLSDYRFMKLCHWLMLPQHSQFHSTISNQICKEISQIK